jgi:hypothetical protein
VFPLNLTYTSLILLQMSSVTMTYTEFSYSKFPLPPTFNQNLLVSFQTVVLSFRQNLFRCIHKIAKSAYYLCPVCPSVRMEQLESHRADFHEIRYLSIFPKSVEKVQVSLKCDMNERYFPQRPIYIFDHISLNYS